MRKSRHLRHMSEYKRFILQVWRGRIRKKTTLETYFEEHYKSDTKEQCMNG